MARVVHDFTGDERPAPGMPQCWARDFFPTRPIWVPREEMPVSEFQPDAFLDTGMLPLSRWQRLVRWLFG